MVECEQASNRDPAGIGFAALNTLRKTPRGWGPGLALSHSLAKLSVERSALVCRENDAGYISAVQ